MENYITSTKDLVIQTMTNGSEIKRKAESGDLISCFQMGIIHLYGINTPVDLKKASSFFKMQSLANNQEANLLLGLIAECEGDYSQAFQHFAKNETDEVGSFIDKVIKGRTLIQDSLKKMDLPSSLNKEITKILSEYSKSKSPKVGSSIKIAAICNDKQSCLEAAKNLCEARDYISAIQWLKKGNVELDNSIYKEISKKLEDKNKDLLNSKEIQVIHLDGNSLLSRKDPTPFLAQVKKSCDDATLSNSVEWKQKAKACIDPIIQRQKDLEQKAISDAKEAEEAKKREEARKRAEEEAKRRAEEKALRRAERKERWESQKQKIMYSAIAIAILVLVVIVLNLVLGSSSDTNDSVADEPIIENPKQVVDKSQKIDNVSPSKSEENTNFEFDETPEEQSIPNEQYPQEEQSTPEEQTSKEVGGYNNVLSVRYLTESDLAGMSKRDLEIMRNSIYARYGYRFKREDLLNYFSQFSWYSPTTSDMGTVYNQMNDNEKYNIDFIKKHE